MYFYYCFFKYKLINGFKRGEKKKRRERERIIPINKNRKKKKREQY